MPNIQAVIFDWAGTTVDFGSTSPVSAFMEAFRRAGIEVTDEDATSALLIPMMLKPFTLTLNQR